MRRKQQVIVYIPLPKDDKEQALSLIRNNNNRENTIQSSILNNIYPRRFYNYRNDSLRYIGNDLIEKEKSVKIQLEKNKTNHLESSLRIPRPALLDRSTRTTRLRKNQDDDRSRNNKFYEKRKKQELLNFKVDDGHDLPARERFQIGNKGRLLTKNELKQNIKNTCRTCSRLFKNTYYFNKHMVLIHKMEMQPKRKIGLGKKVCKICKKTFTSSLLLQWHHGSNHSKRLNK
ncbi:uncharacterized protein BX663DRAFT_553612 [Cokeromyces recurvatus]|uniref:uncharacterized protein n=1 Tax=Cokeromyces recurvatus TaxID=90255 RepID=UPI00221FD40B|nr:uncharacterized protein BX663DRAFT_553612 [Cokeromyces recurvatus]KAI7900973.1 hypothetical protein BX663DRAFT_553612 [Cokeromyces recurvatus]